MLPGKSYQDAEGNTKTPAYKAGQSNQRTPPAKLHGGH